LYIVSTLCAARNAAAVAAPTKIITIITVLTIRREPG
jgi:hypothetical protein